MERIKYKNIEYVVAPLTELDVEMRCDAEFFLGIGLNDKPFRSGKDSTVFSQYGTSKELNEEGDGFPILRLNEFQDLFLGKPSKYCNIITEKTFDSLIIKKNDVLISRTNGNPKLVGKAAVSMKDETFGFASYLFRVRTDENFISPEVLTSYLSSIYGRGEIEKFSMISNQANFSPAKFRKIKIPVVPNSIQEILTDSLKEAYNLNVKSQQLYHEVEQILLIELGLNQWKPKIKKFDLFGVPFEVEDTMNTATTEEIAKLDRIDSEFFESHYYEIIDIINNYSEVGLLKDICNIDEKLTTPAKDTIHKYIELANIGANGIINGFTQELGKDLPSRARRLVKSNQVLISSIEGSLTSCALIPDELNNAFCSTGFYLIDSKKINPETLLVLFKTKPFQALLKKSCSGTILTAISRRSFKNLIIPVIEISIQKKIKKKVNDLMTANTKSKHLLKTSIHAVEIFIEQDEKAAIRFINENLKY
jgi:restriction endonuclease S subunit